jgi:hypothetical protein
MNQVSVGPSLRFVCAQCFVAKIFTLHTVRNLRYWLGGRGSVPLRDSDGIFSSLPPRPDRRWGPPSILPCG